MSIIQSLALLGASGAPTADLGDTIEQSLRFAPSSQSSGPYLYKTGFSNSGDIWTYSCWMKGWGPAGTTAQWNAVLFSWHNNTSSQTVDELAIFGNYPSTGRHEINYYFQGSAAGYAYSNDEFNDESAWYHVVWQSASTSGVKLYVNNREITDWRTQGSVTTQGFINKNQTCSIGARAPGNTSPSGNQYHGEGYLAAAYFIDGTAKSPSDFGKYNEDGVWVPQNYSGSYGTNGFKLTFDSSQTNGIGHDSSGNGNHFTSSGFDEGDVALYSKDLFTESGTSSPDFDSTDKTFATGGEAVNLFDGNSSNEAGTLYSPNSGTWVIFRPETAIVAQTSVKVRTRFCEAIYVNETDTGLDAPAAVGLPGTLVDLSSALSFPITITNIAVRGNSSGGNASEGRITDIEIDGTTLVDNTDNDVDFNDTPTSNFSTWNPLIGPSGAYSSRPEDANLNLRGTGSATLLKKPANKTIYFELEVGYVNNGSHWGFWYNTIQLVNGHITTIPVGSSGNAPSSVTSPGGFCFDLSANLFANNANQATRIDSSNLSAGDIIGVELSDTNITITINGTASSGVNNLALGNSFEDGMYIYAISAASSDSEEMRVNFGQMPFLHRPSSLTDSSELQTNNLPEPTIKNGRDHFDIVTYNGNGSTNAISSLEFQPDFIWIKSRSHSSSHAVYDSVRGVNKEIRPDVTTTEFSFSDSLNSFDSNGFTLGTDTGNGDVNLSGRTYVAYCWKGGGTAVSKTAGTINSSVSANTDAGFSIVSYTGNGTAGATVEHGLNQAPEYIILKDRETAVNWIVYHHSLSTPQSNFFYLNEATAKNNHTDVFNATAPTSSLITLGNSTQSNGSGKDIIAYCFHSVDGFSKIGKYTGNNNSDGPFVYTGFEVRFLLIKVDSADNWLLMDTTRDTTNPVRSIFQPDAANAEEVQAGYADLDFLSNGFKPRATWNKLNGSHSFYYIAFARNPFGGENAPPVTAR